MKLLGSIALILGFSGANISAATILFSSSYLAADGSSVSTTGTKLEAFNFGIGAPASNYDTTVNTVAFTGKSNGVTSPTNKYTSPTGTYFSANSNYVSADFYTPKVGYSGYDTLLSNFIFTYGNSNNTITLSTLEIGKIYSFQIFEADNRTAYDIAGSTIRLTNGANVYNTTQTFGGNTSSGLVINGLFTADAVTQSFNLNKIGSNGTTVNEFQVNAFQLRQVPEPSSALLGGLGFLALLRRRR